MAEYRDTSKVVNEALGVTLALKLRLDTDYHTVVWRQKRPSNTNRRFYFEQGHFWSMPADAALKMMVEAQANGLFADEYWRWPGKSIDPRDSAKMSPERAQELFRETLSRGSEDAEWWDCRDLRIVACREPWEKRWLKAMIVCPSGNRLTFRSFTRENDYENKYTTFRFSKGWMLDRSMMDADGRICQIMMERLKEAFRG
ncbi:MAG: hypothetical protein HY788_12370 [Deltaproteobacteria bacterium]|nr:hypothetical protein [Deltaproteobacteria bacterium]